MQETTDFTGLNSIPYSYNSQTKSTTLLLSQVGAFSILSFYPRVPNIFLSDPYNVLHENEIHFKSSKNLKDPLSHMKPNQLINEDVLVCESIQS